MQKTRTEWQRAQRASPTKNMCMRTGRPEQDRGEGRNPSTTENMSCQKYMWQKQTRSKQEPRAEWKPPKDMEGTRPTQTQDGGHRHGRPGRGKGACRAKSQVKPRRGRTRHPKAKGNIGQQAGCRINSGQEPKARVRGQLGRREIL